MTEQPPSADDDLREWFWRCSLNLQNAAIKSVPQIAHPCDADHFADDAMRRVDALIAQRVSAETVSRQNRDRQRLEQIERLQETVQSLQSAASEHQAAVIRAFGQRIWSDTEEVAYQAGVRDTLERLR